MHALCLTLGLFPDFHLASAIRKTIVIELIICARVHKHAQDSLFRGSKTGITPNWLLPAHFAANVWFFHGNANFGLDVPHQPLLSISVIVNTGSGSPTSRHLVDIGLCSEQHTLDHIQDQ